jgi:hypothetical protein
MSRIPQQIIEGLKRALTSGNDDQGIVVKSVPATKEEAALQSKMDKEVDKAIAILEAVEADRKKFWAMVNMRLDSFGEENMSYNDDSKEIEYRKDS